MYKAILEKKILNYLNSNSHVMIFSDLSKVKNFKILQKKLNVISYFIYFLIINKKNIILPTFNLLFPKKKITDFSTQNITTGYLNKYLTKKYKFKRTKKPMFNYAMIGPDSKNIIKCTQKTAWGEDSVLKYLIDKNTIGVGLNINTSKFNWLVVHYLEEKYKVPYRYYKIFRGYNSSLKSKVFEKMFVRKRKKKTTESHKLIKYLKRDKIIKEKSFKGIDFSFINFGNFYKYGDKKIKKNIMYFCKNEK